MWATNENENYESEPASSYDVKNVKIPEYHEIGWDWGGAHCHVDVLLCGILLSDLNLEPSMWAANENEKYQYRPASSYDVKKMLKLQSIMKLGGAGVVLIVMATRFPAEILFQNRILINLRLEWMISCSGFQKVYKGSALSHCVSHFLKFLTIFNAFSLGFRVFNWEEGRAFLSILA